MGLDDGLREAISMSAPKIVTHYDPKPIPMRRWDWSATFDDYDGWPAPIGFGATEKEAIDDLEEEKLLRE